MTSENQNTNKGTKARSETYIRRASKLFPNQREIFFRLDSLLWYASKRFNESDADSQLRNLCRVAYDFGEQGPQALKILEGIYAKAIQGRNSALTLYAKKSASGPEICPVDKLAQRINQYREENGRMPTIKGLENISEDALLDCSPTRITREGGGRCYSQRVKLGNTGG